ncbi:AraC family transcriptional regulator [Bradyrhizobium sp. Tv2a-2]|uniref:AraC family transcriptional regulator n=1 Tax=Bradyrhizobium sp. Tv2a-2 TaxID=113395 RepID=UPI000565B3F8|nr:AraC family transcriptional regulator [Bradyrhizobium sp. Tv2a-2]
MAKIIARFTPDDQVHATAIRGLYFNRRSSPTQPVHTAQWPCFAMVVQGAKDLKLGQESYRYGVGDYLVVSLDLPVISRVTQASVEQPHFGLGMEINPERLREVMERTGPAVASELGPATRAVAVNRAGEHLVDASLRLLRLLDHPADISALAPLIEQEILYRLIKGPAGPRLVQVAMIENSSNRIARAVTWLKQNYTRPLRIGELAERIGMSTSSFHHHFKTMTAMTPIQYQKQLRLHEARRLMLMERLDVGSAGYRVGYQSPSQFSREYSRLYGISPLRDVWPNRSAGS